MAAEARPTNPTGATVLPSATLAQITSSETRVSKAAGVRFIVEEAGSARPLAGASVPKSNFEQKLEEAGLLLMNANNSGSKEKARAAYQKASEYLNEAEIPAYMRSLSEARCQIGLALTYPYKSAERNSYTNLGEQSNNSVYDNRDSWNDLDKREKVVIYQCLIQNYKNLLALLLDKALRDDIQKKKQDCETILEDLKKETSSTADASKIPSPVPSISSSVPLAPPPAATLVDEPAQKYDMEARFKEADFCSVFEPDKTRNILNEILEHLKLSSIPTHYLMKALCELKLACTYPINNPERAQYRDLCKKTNDFVYENIRGPKWKGLRNEEKIAIYQNLINNYQQLVFHLLSDEADRKEVQDNIKNCEKLLDFLTKQTSSTPPAESVAMPIALPPIAPPSAHESTTAPRAPSSAPSKPAAKQAPRNVTPGPVNGSSKIRMIFGLAIIAIVASVTGVVIYKRYFVKK